MSWKICTYMYNVEKDDTKAESSDRTVESEKLPCS